MASRPPVDRDDEIVLFSDGTLQQVEVQDDVLGRRPQGWDDHAEGYRIDWITITDPEVMRLSGSDRQSVLVADADGCVTGTAWA